MAKTAGVADGSPVRVTVKPGRIVIDTPPGRSTRRSDDQNSTVTRCVGSNKLAANGTFEKVLGHA